jgi:hypothetical protein
MLVMLVMLVMLLRFLMLIMLVMLAYRASWSYNARTAIRTLPYCSPYITLLVAVRAL